jgi:cobalamin biosynthesis protein CobW
MVSSIGGRVDLALLLGLGSATEETIDQRPSHHDHGDEDDHDHDQFESLVLELPLVDREKLVELLQALVREHTILRVKGFLALPDKPMRLVLQGVGQRFDSYFDRRWRDDEAPHSQLVVIGQQLDAALLRRALQPAVVQPAAKAAGTGTL